MKYATLLISALLVAITACGSDEPKNPAGGNEGNDSQAGGETTNEKIYPWEASRNALIDYTDMVLFYGGGRQRYIENWDKDRLSSYVTYTDENGNETWFFDSFLFLEFADYGEGSAMVTYATGYKDPGGNYLDSATKYDWERLINYYFRKGHNLYALDETVGDAIKRLGQPKRKRSVVITVPEPITRQNSSKVNTSASYWGAIDGVQLNFLNDNDRFKACKWYIDRVRELFDKANFQNIELAGFYWIAEKSTNSATVMPLVANYLHKFNESFNWIPYYTAEGYNQWQRWGFDYAYLQPNYFFNDNIPESRLDEACSMAAAANMDMEMEFDDNVRAYLGKNCKAYRLRDYMEGFKRNKVWHNKRLAYYQHNNTVHTLKVSTNPDDQVLYHEFCKFVIDRPFRQGK